MQSPSIECPWLGEISFVSGLQLQLAYAQESRTHCRGFVLGCEHPTSYTVGRRGLEPGDLEFLQGLPVFEADRGGKITLHSPGQLVIYPILPLRSLGLGVRNFVELMELTTIAWARDKGLALHIKTNETGVFSSKGKIASIGIRVDQGVSRHGLAINCNNDLELFRRIRPCGVANQSMDRIGNYLKIQTTELFTEWCNLFLTSLTIMRASTEYLASP